MNNPRLVILSRYFRRMFREPVRVIALNYNLFVIIKGHVVATGKSEPDLIKSAKQYLQILNG